LKFFISFDEEEWHQVRNATGAVNSFNVNYPTRIVLNGDELINEYLYLPEIKEQKKVYLKIEMAAADSNKDTPVIYSLKLKIKTDQVAE